MPNTCRLWFSFPCSSQTCTSCACPSALLSCFISYYSFIIPCASFPSGVSILPLYYYLCRICCLRGLSCCDELSQCICISTVQGTMNTKPKKGIAVYIGRHLYATATST
ncbi:hypothetical protein OH76DRAFT_46871 [Lentinus brumalis]|uniref:Uncharacterized protein n=1 Tax=Lentinus brumalis TaxID=2498619 RepID=A0A371DYB3_9APHY|nr:hypothetical protein OH76DRAFT_46871 [Polyporus brumalis]